MHVFLMYIGGKSVLIDIEKDACTKLLLHILSQF